MNHVAVLINLLIYDESFRFDRLEFIMRVVYFYKLILHRLLIHRLAMHYK